jgi:hypothetical protein
MNSVSAVDLFSDPLSRLSGRFFDRDGKGDNRARDKQDREQAIFGALALAQLLSNYSAQSFYPI